MVESKIGDCAELAGNNCLGSADRGVMFQWQSNAAIMQLGLHGSKYRLIMDDCPLTLYERRQHLRTEYKGGVREQQVATWRDRV